MSRRMVMGWIGFLGLLSGVRFADADETLQKIAWDVLKKEGRIAAGTVEGSGDQAVLRITSEKAGPSTFEVVTIDRPKVSRPRYAIRGRVRTEDVEGKGFLEMWNHFGDKKYFSRTLGERGPMRHLGGSSDWREFVLPFVNREGGPMPDKLELSVVLPGKGSVWLGSLELVHFEPQDTVVAVPGAWWDDRTAGLVFGGLGGVIGIIGAFVGTMCTFGRGRALVLGLLWSMVVVGTASLILGIFALTKAQPYAVYYPPLLLGVLDVAIGGGLIPAVKKRYQDLELRRMSAMDAGRA